MPIQPFKHVDRLYSQAHTRYMELLGGMDLVLIEQPDAPPHPYNLLMTREFMMIVPRRAECVEEMSINAMGFMGSLFVETELNLNESRPRHHSGTSKCRGEALGNN